MSQANAAQAATVTGGCQCGAIRYAVAAPLDEVNVCHCRMCQKAGGGPFMAFFDVPMAAVTFTRGAPSRFASSSLAERGFCSACGTPLTYQRTPDAIGITTGSLDHPEAAVPTTRLGTEGVLPWSETVGRLPITSIEDWQASSGIAPFATHQHPDRDT